MTTRFILVRHGQTAWNKTEQFRGRTDLPLNETGLEQANRVAARLANEKIDAIYSSPLQRTLQTIQPLADTRGIQITKTDALIDIDVGDCAGLTIEQTQEKFPDVADAWQNHPARVAFPNGEAMTSVRERLEKLLAELTIKYANQTIVLVTHRIMCQTLLCLALGLNPDLLWHIQQDNACVNFFEMRDKHFVVTLMNDTSHL
jgi:broad specificity phosphatase PhoE